MRRNDIHARKTGFFSVYAISATGRRTRIVAATLVVELKPGHFVQLDLDDHPVTPGKLEISVLPTKTEEGESYDTFFNVTFSSASRVRIGLEGADVPMVRPKPRVATKKRTPLG